MALLLALAASAAAAEREQPLPVGAAAPDVALSDQFGKPFRLAEARQQSDLVVLAFYVQAFTGG